MPGKKSANKDKKPHLCNTCGEAFSKKRSFKLHLLTHTVGFRTCLLCQKRFSRESNFFNHLLVHCKKANHQVSSLLEEHREAREKRRAAREKRRLREVNKKSCTEESKLHRNQGHS